MQNLKFTEIFKAIKEVSGNILAAITDPNMASKSENIVEKVIDKVESVISPNDKSETKTEEKSAQDKDQSQEAQSSQDLQNEDGQEVVHLESQEKDSHDGHYVPETFLYQGLGHEDSLPQNLGFNISKIQLNDFYRPFPTENFSDMTIAEHTCGINGVWTIRFRYSARDFTTDENPDTSGIRPTNLMGDDPFLTSWSITIDGVIYSYQSTPQTGTIDITETIIDNQNGFLLFANASSDFSLNVFNAPEDPNDITISFDLAFSKIENLTVTILAPESGAGEQLYTRPSQSFSFNGEYTFDDSQGNGFVAGPDGVIQEGTYSGNIADIEESICSNQGGGGEMPIVLDLDGDGIELTALSAGILLDADLDGELENISWVGKDDGILLYDADNNQEFTDINEIALINYHPEATSDLDGLRLAFDSNQDNVFNSEDDAWESFYVWQDANQNAISDEGEIISLDDLGISEISLLSNGQIEYVDDSTILGYASYTDYTGNQQLVADVTFSYQELSNNQALDPSSGNNSDIS